MIMIKNNSMVRLLTTLILVIVLASTAGLSTVDAGSTKSWNGFKYVIKGSGGKYGKGVYIRSYTGNKTSIKIPKKINGRYVVSVDLDEEHLKKINVKKATKLKYLDVSENKLKSINLKHNKKLVKLEISENDLKKLTVKYNKRLVKLDASENKIRSIYLKKNTKLKELDLGKNKLKSIYLKKNTKLRELNLSKNRLTKLDVSKNLKLKELDIEGNSGLGWFTMNNLSNHKYMQEFTDAFGQEWERD